MTKKKLRIIVSIVVFMGLIMFLIFNFGTQIGYKKKMTVNTYPITMEPVISQDIKYKIDGVVIENLSESIDYINRHERTMIPFRYFFEELGYKVKWVDKGPGNRYVIADKIIPTTISIKEFNIIDLLNSEFFLKLLDIIFAGTASTFFVIQVNKTDGKNKWIYFMFMMIIVLLVFFKNDISTVTNNTYYVGKSSDQLLISMFLLMILVLLSFNMKKMWSAKHDKEKSKIFVDLLVDNEILILERDLGYFLSNILLENKENYYYELGQINNLRLDGNLGVYFLKVKRKRLYEPRIISLEIDIKSNNISNYELDKRWYAFQDFNLDKGLFERRNRLADSIKEMLQYETDENRN